jgi:hypothetical protein
MVMRLVRMKQQLLKVLLICDGLNW